MMSESPGKNVREARWMGVVLGGDIEGWGIQQQAHKKDQHVYDVPFWGQKFFQGFKILSTNQNVGIILSWLA